MNPMRRGLRFTQTPSHAICLLYGGINLILLFFIDLITLNIEDWFLCKQYNNKIVLVLYFILIYDKNSFEIR